MKNHPDLAENYWAHSVGWQTSSNGYFPVVLVPGSTPSRFSIPNPGFTKPKSFSGVIFIPQDKLSTLILERTTTFRQFKLASKNSSAVFMYSHSRWRFSGLCRSTSTRLLCALVAELQLKLDDLVLPNSAVYSNSNVEKLFQQNAPQSRQEPTNSIFRLVNSPNFSSKKHFPKRKGPIRWLFLLYFLWCRLWI